MKLINRALVLLFFLCLFFFVGNKAQAAVATQSGTTNIKVTVTGNTLSLKGYIAPFASVVLTINSTVITSTTADEAGNFSFSDISVPKATSTVCLDAVDFKKLGASEACISVTPVDGVISQADVFVPPTLGVQRTDVSVGNDALAFGYGMPGASITVHINGSAGCTVIADSSGYYTCSIAIKKAGSYELFSDSVLKDKPSEKQLKKVLIQGIAVTKLTTITPVVAPQPLPSLTLFEIPWWVWLLLVLIVIILIIILLRRFRPEAIPTVGVPSIHMAHIFDSLFKSHKLHHHWMKGVGF